MTHHIKDQEDLDSKLAEAGSKLVVIDFFATWCGPCKRIAPQIEKMAEEYPDVVFLKIDVDENEELARIYDVSAMPTFVFIKDKSKIENFCGADYEKLKELVDQLL